MIKKFYFFKQLYKPVTIKFNNNFCYLNGILTNNSIFYKKNMFYKLSASIFLKKSNIFDNLINNYFLIHKTYIKCFFSLFLSTLQGISHGYKLKIFLKGKGLRLILRKHLNKMPYIYLKLGYSHKIFFTVPKNVWFRVFGRKRALILYTLNYSILRNIILKLRSFYPMSLYKLRGFFIEKEKISLRKGKARLN